MQGCENVCKWRESRDEMVHATCIGRHLDLICVLFAAIGQVPVLSRLGFVGAESTNGTMSASCTRARLILLLMVVVKYW